MGTFLGRVWHIVSGGLGIAAGIVLSPQVLGILGPKVSGIVSAVGAVLMAFGIIHADGQKQ